MSSSRYQRYERRPVSPMPSYPRLVGDTDLHAALRRQQRIAPHLRDDVHSRGGWFGMGQNGHHSTSGPERIHSDLVFISVDAFRPSMLAVPDLMFLFRGVRNMPYMHFFILFLSNQMMWVSKTRPASGRSLTCSRHSSDALRKPPTHCSQPNPITHTDPRSYQQSE